MCPFPLSGRIRRPRRNAARRTAWEGRPGTAATSPPRCELEARAVRGDRGPDARHRRRRFSFTPSLGVFSGVIGANGDILVPEDRLRSVMANAAVGKTTLEHELDRLLGTPWDNELEPFRRGRTAPRPLAARRRLSPVRPHPAAGACPPATSAPRPPSRRRTAPASGRPGLWTVQQLDGPAAGGPTPGRPGSRMGLARMAGRRMSRMARCGLGHRYARGRPGERKARRAVLARGSEGALERDRDVVAAEAERVVQRRGGPVGDLARLVPDDVQVGLVVEVLQVGDEGDEASFSARTVKTDSSAPAPPSRCRSSTWWR